MELFLLGFFADHPLTGYAIVFLGMVLEGDLILFTAAFLANLGVFEPLPLLLTALSGAVIGDFLWYKLGAHLDRFPKRLVAFIERLAAPFDRSLVRRPLRTLFITKFAYGLHHFVLVRAGTINFPLKLFLKNDALAIFGWLLVIAGLGYFSSFSLGGVKEYLHFAEIGILIGVVVLLTAEEWLRKILRAVAGAYNKDD